MEYEILGGNLPVAICKLTKGEKVYSHTGGMGWFTPGFKMSTNIKGGIFKSIGRIFTKESFFLTTYECTDSEGTIAFPSNFPGSIIAHDLKEGEAIITQKSTLLCAESSVNMSMHIKKQIMFGLFGGEGFIMQKFEGPGRVFLDIDGSTVKYSLQPGEKLLVDHTHIAILSPTIKIKMTLVKGLFNLLFAKEGLFFIELTGPGEVVLQTMPINNVVKTLLPFLKIKNRLNKNASQYENEENNEI